MLLVTFVYVWTANALNMLFNGLDYISEDLKIILLNMSREVLKKKKNFY